MSEEINNNGKSYTILIAEDNEVNMFFLKTLLKINYPDIILLEAQDGEKVMNIFSQLKPDLIFLDLSLPLIDGYDLAKYIKRSDTLKKDVPVIVLTASDSQKVKDHLKKIGIETYIRKPASREIIIDAVNKHLSLV
ncbi:MAG: Polar-differentiation response regulator DivK [Bacteroidetes bacterium ADurb.Bin408]|nr:MAG: Polar-differentiation response regulator DivK [Bacteroidetes bacterium ADurb.Bin408]